MVLALVVSELALVVLPLVLSVAVLARVAP
jgi:hypothetical protein